MVKGEGESWGFEIRMWHCSGKCDSASGNCVTREPRVLFAKLDRESGYVVLRGKRVFISVA